jgi:hypothetical protein
MNYTGVLAEITADTTFTVDAPGDPGAFGRYRVMSHGGHGVVTLTFRDPADLRRYVAAIVAKLPPEDTPPVAHVATNTELGDDVAGDVAQLATNTELGDVVDTAADQ